MRRGAAGPKGRAVSRAARKRALTGKSSSRWAGAITPTSEDQWSLAERNLRAARASLQARVRRIQARLAIPAGGRSGRTRGYATPSERHGKVLRLHALKARLARVERQLGAGTVPVVRGGRALLRKRANLAAAGLDKDRWRAEWESARLFLTADGERDKPCGNETIRWHPDEGWLEVKLPAPLSHLANRPHGRYRISAAVEFSYRGDEVAAQAATGAIRYDITCDPVRGRWYIDASWKAAPAPAVPLDELRQHPSSPWTSTSRIWPSRSSRRTATSWAPRRPSRSTWPGCPPRPGTGGCGPRSAASSPPRTSTAPGRSWSRIWISPGPGPRDASRTGTGPRGAGGDAGSAAPSRASPPPGSVTGWSRWPPTPACTSRWGAGHWLGPLREHHPRRPATTRQRW